MNKKILILSFLSVLFLAAGPIRAAKKNAWWYTTKDGKLEYIGEFDNGVHKFQHDSGYSSGNDHILIVVDSSKDYVKKDWTELPDRQGAGV